MALKQCNECKKEISTTVSSCPNCGSKKPFKGVKLSREETKELSSKERKSFEKAGGKVTTGIFEKLVNLILAIIILFVIFAIISPKSEEEIKKEKIEKAKEIKKIEQTIKSIPAREVEKNLKAYQQLSDYYPNNKKYKEKLLKYKNLNAIATECEISAYKKNRLLLKYPDSFDSVTMDKYYYTKWINTKTVEHQSSFRGKNSFGQIITFVSRYRCYVTGDNTFTYERVLIKEI